MSKWSSLPEFIVLRDSLHPVTLPNFKEVGGDPLHIDQDHTANMVEPKTWTLTLRTPKCMLQGLFSERIPDLSACAHRQGLCVSIYRDLFLKAPERAIIDLARFLEKKKTGLLKSTYPVIRIRSSEQRPEKRGRIICLSWYVAEPSPCA